MTYLLWVYFYIPVWQGEFIKVWGECLIAWVLKLIPVWRGRVRIEGYVRWVLARGGLTMGSGRVAVFWMCWRIVCHPERNEGSRGYFLTPHV